RIPPLFRQHLLALAAGLAAMAAAAAVPLRLWQRLALPLWIAGVVLLVLTHWIGSDVNGARRWLELGIRFQPVEVVKFTTLLVVVAAVAPRDGRRDLSNRRAGLALGLFTLPPVLLLLAQPDLGNAVLLFALTVLLLVVAGRPLRQLLVPAAAAAVLVAAYIANNDYARRRVEGFLDPWTQWETSGFQLVQSFVAFGQGGLAGVGLGNGRQKLDYLFGAHTDFVLALIAEELGLLGVLLVLGAFAALLVTGCRIGLRANDRFGLLLAFAMTSLLTVPAILNGAVVMGLVPTKGLTLPFLSYGGTSLVMCCVSLGVLLGVARQTVPGRRRSARTSKV
ncbi:MAG: FtsW/RodA/SpoVE family cell cycle protein, partial [Myxococcota bacterium]